LPGNRICFTFSRGYGNAVFRNRSRRLGREAFRLIKNRLICGFDFILQVFPDKEEPKKKLVLSDRAMQLETLFTKAGLIK